MVDMRTNSRIILQDDDDDDDDDYNNDDDADMFAVKSVP